jgi:hypothetical protein
MILKETRCIVSPEKHAVFEKAVPDFSFQWVAGVKNNPISLGFTRVGKAKGA